MEHDVAGAECQTVTDAAEGTNVIGRSYHMFLKAPRDGGRCHGAIAHAPDDFALPLSSGARYIFEQSLKAVHHIVALNPVSAFEKATLKALM